MHKIDMIYGQSMGAEIGIELMRQMIAAHITVSKAFFDGAPCITLPAAYKKFMCFKFRTLIRMPQGKSVEEVMCRKFLNCFTHGDTESLRPLIEPLTFIAPIISDETTKREAECCYSFDFPEIDASKQKDMSFFYAKEEEAYKPCMQGVKRAYPLANYEIVENYGHLTYSVKEKEKYLQRQNSILTEASLREMLWHMAPFGIFPSLFYHDVGNPQSCGAKGKRALPPDLPGR